MSFWNPKLPGLRKLSGEDINIRDLADKIIQAKALKAEQALAAPSEREKFSWQQATDIQRQELDRTKFMINKFLEQHNRLTTGIERKILYGQAQTWLSGLDPEMRTMAESMIDLTPLSPNQKKVLDYRSIYRPVEITADYTKDPSTWAGQAFAQAEDGFRFKKFMGDETAQRQDFVLAPDNTVLYKNYETGVVTPIDEKAREVLGALPALKNANMTIEQAVSNGGKVPLGTFNEITDGQTKYFTRPVQNIFNNSISIEKIPVGTATTKSPWTLPETGQKILGYLRMDEDVLKDVKDSMAFTVADFRKKRMALGKDADPKQLRTLIKTTLGPLMPGVNMALRKVDKDKAPEITKDWFFKEYNEETDEYLTFWPGIQTMFQSGTPGVRVPVWHDSSTGSYWYGPDLLGNEEDAIAWALMQHPGGK